MMNCLKVKGILIKAVKSLSNEANNDVICLIMSTNQVINAKESIQHHTIGILINESTVDNLMAAMD